MGIRYIIHNGSHCPVVFCDFCGERIESARKGSVLFPMDYDKNIDSGTIFIHKSCDKLLSQNGFYGNESVPWEEMKNFVNHLTWNLNGGENIISLIAELFGCDGVKFYSDREEIPPFTCGVYLLWCDDRLWYVGKSVDVKSRLASHKYHKVIPMTRIGVIETSNGTSQSIVEASLAYLLNPRKGEQWKLPSRTPDSFIW